jgi:hypothetical protein
MDNVDETASSIVGNSENENDNNDDDTKASDGLIDVMYNFWAAELPEAVPIPTEEPIVEPKAKVKPWSVRSSPSGTYVLDPTTGKMKNITE